MFTEAVLRTWKGQIDVEQKANRMKMVSDQTLEEIYLRLLMEKARVIMEQQQAESEESEDRL